MTKLKAGLLIGAGAFLLLLGIGAAVFYVKVYKPIGAPLMAMSVGRVLEQRQLTNHEVFSEPDSGELSADQVRRFVDVEEAVAAKVAAAGATLSNQQAILERAEHDGQLTLMVTLAAYSEIRPAIMAGKPVQIDAMNRERFSKGEFEWVRTQLYRGADLRLTRLDVSEVLNGVRDAVIQVNAASEGPVPDVNRTLAKPLATRLEQWRAFGFFGL